jgi:PKD repeat protein
LNSPIVMGTKCVADSANIPGTGWETRAVWTDVDGNFWFFGAGTYVTSYTLYNQLWKYCVSSGIWIWISGDVVGDPPGSWGTIGVSSPLNKPSGRIGSAGWTNNNRSLYLFGGEEHGGATYNDLWVYEIDSSCAPCLAALPSALIQLNPSAICPGTCTDFTNLSTNATFYQWFFPGGTPDSSTAFSPSGICYNTSGSYDVMLIATNANGSDTLTLQNYITVFPQPAPQSITQSGDTLFAIDGLASYQWYFNGSIFTGATDYFYVAEASGDYNVIATDTNGCEVEAVINNVIARLTPALFEGEGVTVFPNPVSETIYIRGLETNTADEVSIYNVVGEKVFSAVGCKLPIANCQLSSGMYYIEIISNSKTYRTKFLKQ